MYALANMGHPSREEGFVLCSNHNAADEPMQRVHHAAGFAGCHKRDLVSFSYPFPFG
jgi:hypothetical protein